MGNLDPLFPTLEMMRKRIQIGIHWVKMIQVDYSEMRTFFDQIVVSSLTQSGIGECSAGATGAGMEHGNNTSRGNRLASRNWTRGAEN